MAKNSIRDYANTAASNTDVQSQNIDEGCSPAGINNAIREIMADLADVNDGTISLVSPDFDAATINSVAIDAFPSGTKMLFQQTSAPTGWTKDTSHNDKALRITSGTVGTGGSVAFETAFASQSVAGSISNSVSGSTASHTLLLSEIPSHNHTGVVQQREDFNPTTGTTTQTPLGFGDTRGGSRASASPLTIDNAGGGGGHSHGAGTLAVTSTFTGTAIDLDVNYVDVIIAAKD